MTTSLMYFELVRVVCQPKIKDERKLNCAKAIFILIRTLTSAQPIWCKSSTWLSLILSEKSNTNQVLYRFEQVRYLLCWKLGRTLVCQNPFIHLGGKRHGESYKFLAQEHNTMCPAGVRTRTTRSGDKRTNLRPLCLSPSWSWKPT